jgi:reactive intermediate/imine deaminase
MKEDKVAFMTAEAPTPSGPYSQAIIANGFIFVAGQRPQDPVTGAISDDVREQTRQCLQNVKAILDAAGSSMANIVRTNVYLSDIADFSAMNEVYSSMIPEPYPARTTVGAQLRGIKVEIEVIALQGARYEK